MKNLLEQKFDLTKLEPLNNSEMKKIIGGNSEEEEGENGSEATVAGPTIIYNKTTQTQTSQVDN